MANVTATVNGNDKLEAVTAIAADEMKLIADTIGRLPEHAVKELMSIGVCIRCIFRLFGVNACVYSSAMLSPQVLSSIFGKSSGLKGELNVNGSDTDKDASNLQTSQELVVKDGVCSICLGILQFVYYVQNNELVKSDCARGFAARIADVIKKDGHLVDNFFLEVSLPPVITENEESVWLLIQKKFHSEEWYQKIVKSEIVSTKEVLKLALTNPLELLMGVKSDVSSFRIRLTFTSHDESMNVRSTAEKNQCSKRRKTDDENSDVCSNEVNGSNMQIHETTDCHVKKVDQPCRLTFVFSRAPIYIGGRYLKYSRNVSQTRWIIDDERMGEASVEEIIGSNILPTCHGDSYKFHAAGREDIDVRMLGSGRPFLIEIQNARHVPSDASIDEIERKINGLEKRLVMVKNLKVLGSEAWNMMREGEAEKQKQYVALVWISRCLEDNDMETVSSFKDMQILQRTPIRVLHRRSPLEREKIIHWMKVERIAASSQYFLLHLCTQAGTYIKEFVHGDLGRTHPSIGSILGCRAEILQLDVTDVKMDCFLANKIL